MGIRQPATTNHRVSRRGIVCITDEPVDELLFPFPRPLPLPFQLLVLVAGMPTAITGSGMAGMEPTIPFGGDSVMSMTSCDPGDVSPTSQSLLSSESSPDEVLPRL